MGERDTKTAGSGTARAILPIDREFPDPLSLALALLLLVSLLMRGNFGSGMTPPAARPGLAEASQITNGSD